MCKSAGVGVVVTRSQVDVAGARVISLPVIGRFNGLRMKWFIPFRIRMITFSSIYRLLLLNMNDDTDIMP